MSNPRIPSTTLLRTFLKPNTLPQCTVQTRHASNYTPHARYAKVTRLDKLHRVQKAALREQKAAAFQRADSITATLAPSTTSSAHFPFTITRTRASELPVYEAAKNGGNRHITTIRKLSGDLDNLAAQLRVVLKLPEHTVDQKGNKKVNVAVNRLTNHVIVRGWRGQEVKAWLAAVGF